MKGHFVILANMNTKTRDGLLGPGAWYKPHYRLQEFSWSFYGIWMGHFNVSGKVVAESFLCSCLFSEFYSAASYCGRAL